MPSLRHAFNRTTLELKFLDFFRGAIGQDTFNRTTLELKYKQKWKKQ